MDQTKPKRTAVVSVKIEPELRDRLRAVAEREHRTLSQQVRKILLESLGGKGSQRSRVRT